MTRYTVKVRRFYGDREVTSIIGGPTTLDIAEDRLDMLRMWYQDDEAYYIEEFDEEKWGKGFS